jgi:hypothetical protein
MLGKILDYKPKEVNCKEVHKGLTNYLGAHARHIADASGTRSYLSIPFFSTRIDRQVYLWDGICAHVYARQRFGRVNSVTVYLLSDTKDVEPLEQIVKQQVEKIVSAYNQQDSRRGR